MHTRAAPPAQVVSDRDGRRAFPLLSCAVFAFLLKDLGGSVSFCVLHLCQYFHETEKMKDLNDAIIFSGHNLLVSRRHLDECSLFENLL